MKPTTETKIIELVKLGHDLAKELHCAESAALVSDLASQLEVQYVRAEVSQREFRSADITMQNLEAKCEKLAAENAALKSVVAELVTGRLNLQWILNVYAHGYEEAKEQIAKDIEIKARLCRESNSLFDRLRAAEKRIAELENDCWIYEGTVKKLLERAESAEATKQKVVLPEPIGWKSPSWSEVIRKSDIISALSKAGIEIAAGIGKGA